MQLIEYNKIIRMTNISSKNNFSKSFVALLPAGLPPDSAHGDEAAVLTLQSAYLGRERKGGETERKRE